MKGLQIDLNALVNEVRSSSPKENVHPRDTWQTPKKRRAENAGARAIRRAHANPAYRRASRRKRSSNSKSSSSTNEKEERTSKTSVEEQ